MMDINGDWLQWFIDFLIKKTFGGAAMIAQSKTLATPNKSAL